MAKEPTPAEEMPSGWEDWPKRAQVAKMLEVTETSVVRFEKAGNLNPILDPDGCYRFEPAEVAVLAASRGKGNIRKEAAITRSEELREWETSTIKSIVGLIEKPREKIDEIQFEIIKDLRAENLILRTKIEAMWAEVETARDNTAERNMAQGIVMSETRIKELALHRLIEKGGQLLMGFKGMSGGVQLTPDQCEQLLIAAKESPGEESFLTPEQETLAKAIVTRNKEEATKKAAKPKAEATANDAK
jgi:hypothetical protein